MSEENGTKKARKPKSNSIPATEVKALVADLPQYDKTSFLVVGHRNGVRLALPNKTAGVSRAFFYGDGDYTLIPEDEAITVLSEEERKQGRRGGVMAEVNFELGVEAARRALTKLVDAVKAAPAPKAKPKTAPKAKKEPKVVTELALDDSASLTED